MWVIEVTDHPSMPFASRKDLPMSTTKRTLVVEDDPITSGAVRMFLQWEGYRVDCAADGREALDRLRQAGEKPDLILLDVLMPVLDGQQFREEQRRDPALNGIPVVVVSAADIGSSLDASIWPHSARPSQRTGRTGGRGMSCKAALATRAVLAPAGAARFAQTSRNTGSPTAASRPTAAGCLRTCGGSSSELAFALSGTHVGEFVP
jgi:CheY-like chemotaxis protein